MLPRRGIAARSSPLASQRQARLALQGGFVHTNPVESHFALLKRGVFGTFHNISEAHFHRYLAGFDFRANTRDMTDGDRAAALLAGARKASGSRSDRLTKPRTVS